MVRHCLEKKKRENSQSLRPQHPGQAEHPDCAEHRAQGMLLEGEGQAQLCKRLADGFSRQAGRPPESQLYSLRSQASFPFPAFQPQVPRRACWPGRSAPSRPGMCIQSGPFSGTGQNSLAKDPH